MRCATPGKVAAPRRSPRRRGRPSGPPRSRRRRSRGCARPGSSARPAARRQRRTRRSRAAGDRAGSRAGRRRVAGLLRANSGASRRRTRRRCRGGRGGRARGWNTRDRAGAAWDVLELEVRELADDQVPVDRRRRADERPADVARDLAGAPAAANIAPSSSLVVVLPFVPVTPTNGLVSSREPSSISQTRPRARPGLRRPARHLGDTRALHDELDAVEARIVPLPEMHLGVDPGDVDVW